MEPRNLAQNIPVAGAFARQSGNEAGAELEEADEDGETEGVSTNQLHAV